MEEKARVARQPGESQKEINIRREKKSKKYTGCLGNGRKNKIKSTSRFVRVKSSKIRNEKLPSFTHNINQLYIYILKKKTILTSFLQNSNFSNCVTSHISPYKYSLLVVYRSSRDTLYILQKNREEKGRKERKRERRGTIPVESGREQ